MKRFLFILPIIAVAVVVAIVALTISSQPERFTAMRTRILNRLDEGLETVVPPVIDEVVAA
jgi:regulator of protease activity HflC (stomatin/prohibitin superfamily)